MNDNGYPIDYYSKKVYQRIELLKIQGNEDKAG